MNMIYVKKELFQKLQKAASSGKNALLGVQELIVVDVVCVLLIAALMAAKFSGVLPALSSDALWVGFIFLVINVVRLAGVLRRGYEQSD